jgi:hypothetical protein
MNKQFIESKTAQKNGWGQQRFRSVTRLTPEERCAVKAGHVVWFSFTPWHYRQSGYKIVTHWGDRGGYWGGGFDSREPTPDELAQIKNPQA